MLLGSIEQHARNPESFNAGGNYGLCTCPKCGKFPNLYSEQEDGEDLYKVRCDVCMYEISSMEASIEDALDAWMSTAEDQAMSLCDDAQDGLHFELRDGYNAQILYEFEEKWTFTVEFESYGDTYVDDTVYNSPKEVLDFYEGFNKWLLFYYGGAEDTMDNMITWLKGLFKSGKAPTNSVSASCMATVSKPAEAPAAEVPTGHLVVPVDWVRGPGEKEKMRKLQVALKAAEGDANLSEFAKFLGNILK